MPAHTRAPPTTAPGELRARSKEVRVMMHETKTENTPSVTFDDLSLTATGTQFRAWLDAMHRIGGCANPVYLVGHSVTRDAVSGAVLHVFTSASQPYGRLAVACRNRRASRCEPCSWLHHGDTYQLVVSGLLGGKGVPDHVREHPRLFATLTAPSFGAVHRATDTNQHDDLCHPRRDVEPCVHGNRAHCPGRHESDDPAVGAPLCADCYNYPTAVLWNASAGRLWNRFTEQVRYNLAMAGGYPGKQHARHARVSFAKVAEFQRRGNVHFHAIIRVDAPHGPASGQPPAWVTVSLLADAIRQAARSVRAPVPDPRRPEGAIVLRLGRQLDIQHIHSRNRDTEAVTDEQVAGYIAKYVTKGDIPGLVLDRRLRTRAQIDAAPLSEHAKTLIRTAWDLGQREEYRTLNLSAWAHQLGYRGNIATKSRMYSTTYAALRQARADYRREQRGESPRNPETTVTSGHWEFKYQGHTPTQAMYAAGIADDIATERQARRETRLDPEMLGLGWVGRDS